MSKKIVLAEHGREDDMNGTLRKERVVLRQRALQHASLELARTLVAVGATRQEADEMMEYACKVVYGEYRFPQESWE